MRRLSLGNLATAFRVNVWKYSVRFKLFALIFQCPGSLTQYARRAIRAYSTVISFHSVLHDVFNVEDIDCTARVYNKYRDVQEIIDIGVLLRSASDSKAER